MKQFPIIRFTLSNLQIDAAAVTYRVYNSQYPLSVALVVFIVHFYGILNELTKLAQVNENCYRNRKFTMPAEEGERERQRGEGRRGSSL